MPLDAAASVEVVEGLFERKNEIEDRLQDLGVNIHFGKATAVVATKNAVPSGRGGRRRRPTKKSNESAAAEKAEALDEDTSNDDMTTETGNHLIPYVPKTDTHWDFVMKEMMWLGADFQGERKRQVALARKMASSVKQFHKTKESRRLRELQQAEMKRRKLAAKLGRDVMRGWWSKIEKIVTYKQKLQADQERQAAMNKQLVVLVQQTEKYTESLTNQDFAADSDDEHDSEDDESSVVSDNTTGESGDLMDDDLATTSGSESEGGKRRRRRRRRRMTIEEALASETSLSRRSKKKVIDYSRMKIPTKDSFYGESTASDGSGSDGSYDPMNASDENDDSDNDSTFQQAMEEELQERNRKDESASTKTTTFLADPEELRKLREEVTMDIHEVIDRLQQEGDEGEPMDVDSLSRPATPVADNKAKHVSFSETVEEKLVSPAGTTALNVKDSIDVPKYDADDDADASDVEDYNDEIDHRSDEEFQADEAEVDDETTMEQEESMPREISASDEIDLLKQEGDLPIEELRRLYKAMEQKSVQDDKEDEEVFANESNEIDGDHEDFEPPVEPEVDDETTIDAEERLGRDMTYEEEMDMLKRESELPIDQLRAMYAQAMANDDSENAENDDEIDEDSDIPEAKTPMPALSMLSTAVHAQDTGSEGEGADEFEFHEADAVDDETTMEAEERLGRDISYQEEIVLLKQESEMSVEELRAKYVGMGGDSDASESDAPSNSTANTENVQSLANQLAASGDNDDEDDFAPDEAVVDDETTIEVEERLGRDMSPEDEIALLKRESEMSIEELRAMYSGGLDNNTEPDDRPVEGDFGNSSKRKRDRVNNEDESEEGLKKRRAEDAGTTSDDGLAALSALEASAQKAQQTLASRPFLLAPWVKLRHYQQVGLNWLVSLQSRRLNGVLADEMGLGKTLQTIALLSYLASYKGIWGPHLIVVPTSVIINWTTELKRFCPALKVLTYYGTSKRRKELRQGWTKSNWYHVVITSYQLAVQDAFAFKRKKWYYLVLDEAQNIKNFQSQRWQTLINFNTQRRLLLTGTPLQNNLMELWSLLHFLMPYIFRSRKEFAYWFSNPMTNIIEGNASRNDDVIKRLHGIIRPFVLRRLKKDVETQMPGKFEHVVKCQLSRRQMTLYEEFLSRSSTRVAMKKGGNFLGMMNVLMQLRKVCNHPDLFEPRSVITPFVLPALSLTVPPFICGLVKSSSLFSTVSRHLVEPIWSGSQGMPSIDTALRHDQVESAELRRICSQLNVDEQTNAACTEDCPDELKELVQSVYRHREAERRHNIAFQNKINNRRCHAGAFCYPETLLVLLEVEKAILNRSDPVEVRDGNIMLTPEALLKMRKTEQDRATDMAEIIDKFVFCVPPAGAKEPELHAGNRSNTSIPTKNLDEMLLEPLEELNLPYRKTQARLSSFFPDKKLIQFDAGKLQTLAELLHKLKRGGHRCLIFTQMSKMLDILEAFLNLNGHTYLRLDGATGVERRQRYMDRFNNDTKIFCFILSTRSGGMGINLTGADTVIFYDSDWNPAMDAQAQDRAHRIGQTREVHIYRLITEHTIEENILLKAKQKKNLDIMVMDQGKFDASHKEKEPVDKDATNSEEMKDVYTKGGLRAILGVSNDEVDDAKGENEEAGKDASKMSSEQMEKAMASLEDEDDVQALHGAQKEAAEEMKEFDENAEILKESDAEDDDEEGDAAKGRPKKKTKKAKTETTNDENVEGGDEETELEKEFAAWQTSVGFDATAIESSLTPMERYGLSFREHIDPFYSIFYINELRRKAEATENQEEIDIEEIEREKAMEERKAMDDGDLLATRPRPERLVRQRNLYRRERARLRSDKKRRKITGENWIQQVDGLTKGLFWYNEDTGEATWNTPIVVTALRAEEEAAKKGWGFLQTHVLAQTMEYLVPYPDRQSCALVCKQWKLAASDFRFVRHVYPVEMGTLGRDVVRREPNHFGNIEEALSIALPGDTIELSDGHYWVSDAGLSFDKPVRLIGDENNPSNVVLEMNGSLIWSCKGGFIEGVTFRRPKMTTSELPSLPMLSIEGEGRVDLFQCVLDNDGSKGSVVKTSGSGNKGNLNGVSLRNGGCHGLEVAGEGVAISLIKSTVYGNRKSGIACTDKATFTCKHGTIRNNGSFGLDIASNGSGTVIKCQFRENSRGPVQREPGCNLTASMNTAIVARMPKRGIPGFKIMTKGQYDKETKGANVVEEE